MYGGPTNYTRYYLFLCIKKFTEEGHIIFLEEDLIKTQSVISTFCQSDLFFPLLCGVDTVIC